MGIEFNVAAKAKEAEELRASGDDESADDLELVEVPIDGKIFRAKRPDASKLTVVLTADAQQLPRMILKLIEDMFTIPGKDGQDGKEVKKILQDLIWEGAITFSDLFIGTEQNPNGLILQIASEFGGRPTEPSTASAASAQTGGRKSTVRSRGKGSTPSPSA